MNMQHMDGYNGGGRVGRGGMGGARSYQGRVSMPDYSGQNQQQYGGQQVYNPQAYGGLRGAAPPVSGGFGGVRYPAGYGGAATAVGMGRGVPATGGYPASQMYAQQAQPIGYYGYGFRYAANVPLRRLNQPLLLDDALYYFCTTFTDATSTCLTATQRDSRWLVDTAPKCREAEDPLASQATEDQVRRR
jgi:hypothetical protein